MTTREQRLTMADGAAARAASLARQAEDYAHSSDSHYQAKTTLLAAAGALWADVARTHAAIAQALPDTDTPED